MTFPGEIIKFSIFLIFQISFTIYNDEDFDQSFYFDVSDSFNFIAEITLGSEEMYSIPARSSIDYTTNVTVPIGTAGGTVSRVTAIASPTNNNEFVFDVFFVIVRETELSTVSTSLFIFKEANKIHLF